MPDGSSTAHLYHPKLLTTIGEGYGLADLQRDATAGLTVAVVALPLSMAIAVASGVTPERGLFTAIIGGCLVSALGGSRYQIGGPAGAFIVLVAATVSQFGLDGLLLTVLVSGLLLTLIGALGLGSLIRHMPHPVTVGFTCGIAGTIFSSQIRDLFGLILATKEPGPVVPKLVALGSALPTMSWAALGIGVGTSTLIFALRRWRPNWPGMLIAIAVASAATLVFDLPIETIGTRFGEIPQGLPVPHLPSFSLDLIVQILPTAFSFTLLGGVESLLSAKVADSMTGRKHRSNMELMAQGIANIASAMFGGISVTGTIARTATNIRAGARSPLSGMIHAGFLLLFMMVAAPLARYIPLAALAGVLVVVCWSMAEKEEFVRLVKNWRSAAVLVPTFALTLLKDLTSGIVVGCALAALLAWPGSPQEEEDA
ncbi:SulP family inorganic anion transporter [Bradyrhizobium sp. CCBAU 53338]|uniref:SulP family inorganic anion transporter n=1 Tax=Bradyrhizobium sp. CCBAU 53338 TaxID=1325111 RepID=UPI00188B453C|nr:SulP family inorganic anion transporter [Bradyrhizobium sp. CCBAU 53338]